MCVYYSLTITKLASEHKINSLLLDYDLVSIEDYSIRGSIKRDFYE